MRGLIRRVVPWSLALSGVVAIGWSALSPAALAPPALAATQRPEQKTPTAAPYRADSLAEAIVGLDPFSPARHAPALPYDPARGAAPPPAVPAKPALILRGLVWGQFPAAILDGLPGIEGPRVLRVGDTLSGLTLRHIDSVRVVIADIDTVWTLRMRNP